MTTDKEDEQLGPTCNTHGGHGCGCCMLCGSTTHEAHRPGCEATEPDTSCPYCSRAREPSAATCGDRDCERDLDSDEHSEQLDAEVAELRASPDPDAQALAGELELDRDRASCHKCSDEHAVCPVHGAA